MKDFQMYKFGKNSKDGNNYIWPISIYYYNQDGKLEDSTHTSYKCEREGQKMIMTVLFHAGKYSGSRVSITQTNTSQLYPASVTNNSLLDDFSIDMNIEGGFAGFLGAVSKALFYERQAKLLTSTQYSIIGKLTFKSYLLGLKISTSQYRFSETLDLSNGLIFQKFVEAKGNYFTIELKQ